MDKSSMFRKLLGIGVVVFVLGGGGNAWALSIDPGFDLFATPGGGTSSVMTPFGTVVLKGVPIFPGTGDTDTIVRRTGASLPPGGTSPPAFDIELVALSLVSVAPIMVAPMTFADLHVVIDQLGIPTLAGDGLPPSPGMLTILTHDDMGGGGTFSSFFDVFAEIILTIPGGDPTDLSDILGAMMFQDQFSAEGCWSHTPRADDPHGALGLPAGNFYPGVHPGSPCQQRGVPGGKVLTPEMAMLAAHGVLPGQTPEPATFVLLASGLAGLAVWRRRQVKIH